MGRLKIYTYTVNILLEGEWEDDHLRDSLGNPREFLTLEEAQEAAQQAMEADESIILWNIQPYAGFREGE